MDPNKTLENLRESANKVFEITSMLGDEYSEFHKLASDFKELDEWIIKGGFIPSKWTKAQYERTIP